MERKHAQAESPELMIVRNRLGGALRCFGSPPDSGARYPGLASNVMP